jgi:hypothetical protein
MAERVDRTQMGEFYLELTSHQWKVLRSASATAWPAA